MSGGARHALRVARARLQARIGIVRLTWAVARGRVDEVWFGDSHAVLFATPRFPFPGLDPVAERRWVWHQGPRLMYSVARDDFLPAMYRWLWPLRLLPGSARVRWFVSFGEIDIRCHLAPRLAQGADLGFVSGYAERVTRLARHVRAREVLVVVPPPPCADTFDHDAFPVVGTPAERLAAHRAVRARLEEEVARTRDGVRLRLLDLTRALAGPDGLMRAELTDDGCHTNDAGRAVVRREVEQLVG